MNQTLSPFAISLSQLSKDFWWTGIVGRTSLVIIGSCIVGSLNHNPVALLKEVDVDNASEAWKKPIRTILSLSQKVQSPTIMYFCMEFGLHESFPIYSGGLGILTSDHIRSAATYVSTLLESAYFTEMDTLHS